MQTFSTLTLLFALSAAAPHAINHFRLHERGLHVDGLALKPLVERDLISTNLVERQLGACSSSNDCGPGMCCSQYGYCGEGPRYCGTGRQGPSPFAQPSNPAPYNPSPSNAAPPRYSAAPSAAPAPSSGPSPPSGGPGGSGFGNVYRFYSGTGSPSNGWPAESQWMSFDSMWNANLPTMSISCSQFGQQNNSPQESNELKSAIQSVGGSSGIDPRFILAVVMQESKGCVRVVTTDNGVTNPGLMQSHDGTGSCFGMDPCPSSQIVQMIQDGTQGTAAGDGLKQTLAQTTGTDVAQKYYQAGVIYNSGNLPQNLDDNTATPCYASDIANRLTGWTTGVTKCTI